METPADPEDAKIIALARAARVRGGAAQGACVRDTDGRTYAAVPVELPHLRLSPIAVTVAMAVSSGALGLEAAALCSLEPPAVADLDILADLHDRGGGRGARLWHVDESGSVVSVTDLDE